MGGFDSGISEKNVGRPVFVYENYEILYIVAITIYVHHRYDRRIF